MGPRSGLYRPGRTGMKSLIDLPKTHIAGDSVVFASLYMLLSRDAFVLSAREFHFRFCYSLDVVVSGKVL